MAPPPGRHHDGVVAIVRQIEGSAFRSPPLACGLAPMRRAAFWRRCLRIAAAGLPAASKSSSGPIVFQPSSSNARDGQGFSAGLRSGPGTSARRFFGLQAAQLLSGRSSPWGCAARSVAMSVADAVAADPFIAQSFWNSADPIKRPIYEQRRHSPMHKCGSSPSTKSG